MFKSDWSVVVEESIEDENAAKENLTKKSTLF